MYYVALGLLIGVDLIISRQVHHVCEGWVGRVVTSQMKNTTLLWIRKRQSQGHTSKRERLCLQDHHYISCYAWDQSHWKCSLPLEWMNEWIRACPMLRINKIFLSRVERDSFPLFRIETSHVLVLLGPQQAKKYQHSEAGKAVKKH